MNTSRAYLFGAILLSGITVTGCEEPGAGPEPPTVVAAVRIEPEEMVMTVGDSVRLTATPVDSAGVPIEGRGLEWRSLDPSIATVDDAGRIRAVAVGVGRIVASAGEVEAEARVLVNGAPGSRVLLIDPPTLWLSTIGETARLAATTRGLAQPAVRWRSTAPDVMTVDQSGIVTAVGPGNAVIVATAEADTSLVVSALGSVYLDTLAISPESAAIQLGDSLALRVDGGVAVGWSSSDSTVVRIDSAGMATGLRPGTVLVQAVALEYPAVSAAATLQVVSQISPPSIATITAAGTTTSVAPDRLSGEIDVAVNVDVPSVLGPSGAQLLLDDQVIGSVAYGGGQARVVFTVDTSSYPNGAYTLTPRVTDGAGAVVVSGTALSVSISN